MVVHPSAGHWNGTLVHALMYRCRVKPLPLSRPPRTLQLSSMEYSSVDEDETDEEGDLRVFRPGIVHRLDIGTSGLLVVAKNDASHAILSDKFKNREVIAFSSVDSWMWHLGVSNIRLLAYWKTERAKWESENKYWSGSEREKTAEELPVFIKQRKNSNLELQSPDNRWWIYRVSSSEHDLRAENIAKFLEDDVRFTSLTNLEGSDKEPLAWSMVLWKLETGRTHQIRSSQEGSHSSCNPSVPT